MRTLSNLNSRFTYRGEDGDSWRIMKGLGAIQGDCEDYSLTLLWMLEGKSMWRFWLALLTWKYMIFFCKIKGDGHAVMRRRSDGKWIDNVHKKWVSDLPGYSFRIPYTALGVALKMVFTWE